VKILTICGHIALINLIIFFSLFFLTSAVEREKRALFRSFFCLSVILSLYISILLLRFFYANQLLALVGILFIFSLLFLLFSPSPTRQTKIISEQKKIDERDVIFSRFDLREGTPSFKNYYSRRPEFKNVDADIRRYPDILSPEHMKRNPLLFSLAAAEFEILEHFLPHVDGDVFHEKKVDSAQKNTVRIKHMLGYFSSALNGVCSLEQAYVYSYVGRGPEAYGKKIINTHNYAVIFAVEMDFNMIACAPQPQVIIETGRRYVEAAKISVILAEYIRSLGYSARAHIAGSNYQTMLVPLAWKAGLGELGRLGIIISKKYGPRIRLGCVTTDLPLVPDGPVIFGVQDFCRICKKCAMNCPAQAISQNEKKDENGVLKWTLNREECYKFWRKTGTDCGMCLYVCPYSKPRNLFHDSIRAVTANSRLAQRLVVWGDDLFYGRSPIQKNTSISPE